MNDDKVDTETLGKAALMMPVLLVFGTAIYAYDVWAESFVLHKLWEWYAVPRGLRAFDQYAFALPVLAWSVLRRKMPRNEPADSREKWMQIVGFWAYFWSPWVVLALGWWFK